jgi:glycosyltransferase involved in cell wall biosynthesis
MSALNGKPRLCVVGSLVGCNPGRVTSQGEILAAHFTAAGYSVTATSGAMSRYVRLIEIVDTLVRSRRLIDTVLLQVYGGRSFVVEDIASALARRFGHRIVMHLHGGAMPTFMARFPRWTRRVLSRADAIVAPSPFLTRWVAQHGWAASTIPNIVDVTAYSFRQRAPASPRLFWMRSFHSIYNPVMALRVLRLVRAVLPEATLTMGGQDKGLEPSLRREAVRIGVADAVRFVGFLDRAGKMREGEAADIFINTNRIDNTPVAVIEACAMGLPVVSTDVGGIRDLLTDGVSGLLVPDDDVPAMAEAILRLVGDPRLAERLSINGRQLAEASSWEQVRVQWERLFAQLDGHTTTWERAS